MMWGLCVGMLGLLWLSLKLGGVVRGADVWGVVVAGAGCALSRERRGWRVCGLIWWSLQLLVLLVFLLVFLLVGLLLWFLLLVLLLWALFPLGVSGVIICPCVEDRLCCS